MRRVVFAIWLASLLFLVVQAAVAYPDLPERVATHFDARGEPNGWMGRSGFYLLWAVTVVVSNAVPVTVALLMRTMMEKTPYLVNVPRKRYWLATPERRAHAAVVMQRGTMAVAVACNVLFAQVFDLIWKYAVDGTATISVDGLLTPFGVILVGALVYIFYTFLRTPDEQAG